MSEGRSVIEEKDLDHLLRNYLYEKAGNKRMFLLSNFERNYA